MQAGVAAPAPRLENWLGEATPVAEREVFDPMIHVIYLLFYCRTPHNVSYLVFRTARGPPGRLPRALDGTGPLHVVHAHRRFQDTDKPSRIVDRQPSKQ